MYTISNNLSIRKTSLEDLEEVCAIYDYARTFMKDHGNPDQWGDNRPSKDTIKQDIINGNSYLVLCDDIIVAVFAFIVGDDPTYAVIDGAWLNDDPYGTLHRIAGNGKAKGILSFVLRYIESLEDNIRIDTHEDNDVMNNALKKHGYQYCGIITVDDGTLRNAYHKKINGGN